MKFNDLKKWTLSDETIGLLLFVERSLELSYDGTPVPEKRIEPTVWEILDDCYKLVSLVESGVRKNARDELDYFLEKLVQCIKGDPIAKDMVYGVDNYILNRLNTQSIEELRTLLNLLKATFSAKKYWAKLQLKTLNLVMDKKNKREILECADKCFYFLIRVGYVKSSIYYLLQKIFFYDLSDGVVKDSSYLNNYFDLFDLQAKVFDVYFKCSNATGDLEGGFDIFSISYVTDPQPKYGLKIERKFFKKEGVNYILCSEVRALDYMHAVYLARDKLSKISNIFSFMHHKSKFWYSNDCLIYNNNKEHVKLLNLPSNIMSKTADVGIDYAKKNLGIFLRGFRMSKHSFERFNQSIELHALALKTESLSAQLLNLWICIESLLVTGKGSHVGEVENYLTHIICNDYLAAKLEDLDLYLLNWKKDFYESLLEKVDSLDNERNIKLARLLCFKEHEPILKEIGAELSLGTPSPLLLNKLWEASQLLRSVSHITEARKKIKEKIKFDIKRIYLMRNEIVHQGEVKARDNLVEIAHYYLDSILNTIVIKSYERRREIRDFLYEQKMIGEEYERILTNAKDDVVDESNFKRIIFSPDYNLYFD
ncbi:hypothetical protein K8D14_07995 [Enterobacter kobei]|uniref:HEPN domain-containing protein n=1 Tax=Enterobacter kobei TaxID=208224 RepID=UPI00207C3859|nr:HEPN domain-containing protein [Enterobacter kobei]MCO4127671.1 hypothetical protein [Enterobacter kobei]MCO4184595.1 hypothetical protein [Enterobacter kobei]HDR2377799.1 hypothetical protein [Enterobacter kobei]